MDRSTYFKDFRRTGGLTQRKLKEYIPTMIMTNLSVLLLVSVDGLVVGNFDGLATSVEYQYLLNMNYTRIIFAKK